MKQCIKFLAARRRPWLAGLFMIAVAAALLPARPAVAGVPSAAGNTPQIVVTIQPLALILRDLVGDEVTVEVLLDAGEDPHHVALQPSRRLQLERADLVIWVGPALESFLARPLANFPANRLAAWLPDAGAAPPHHHHSADPHPWLAPDEALDFTRRLAVLLAARYPRQAEGIEARLAAFEVRHQAQVADLARRMAALHGAAFVAEHAAYGPFADYFGLDAAGSLSDSAGVAQGPRNLWTLENRSDITCVAVERAPPSPLATRLARELAVPVVEIDPFAASLPATARYSDLLELVASGFEQCLNPEP